MRMYFCMCERVLGVVKTPEQAEAMWNENCPMSLRMLQIYSLNQELFKSV